MTFMMLQSIPPNHVSFWLLINILTAIITSSIIGMFDGTIDKMVALAVLMPIIASMGGNAGTQTPTLAVQALAMNEITTTNLE